MAFRLTTEILQQLKEVRKQLPTLPNEKQEFRKVKGEVIIEQGHAEVRKGGLILPVEKDELYDLPFIKLEEVDHSSNLRSAYISGGMLAVHLYIMNTASHREVMREKYPHAFDEEGVYNPLAEHEPSSN